MRGSVDLRLSKDAEQDLRGLGRLERRLIPQVIKDQLVAPSSADVALIDPDNFREWSVERETSSPLTSQRLQWLGMRIGKNVVLVRQEGSPDGGEFGGYVARILPASTPNLLRLLHADEEEVAAKSSGSH